MTAHGESGDTFSAMQDARKLAVYAEARELAVAVYRLRNSSSKPSSR